MVPPLLLVSVKHSSDTEMNGFETTVVISYISMRSELGADGRTILKRILTLVLLMWRIWCAPNNANKWHMEFNP